MPVVVRARRAAVPVGARAALCSPLVVAAACAFWSTPARPSDAAHGAPPAKAAATAKPAAAASPKATAPDAHAPSAKAAAPDAHAPAAKAVAPDAPAAKAAAPAAAPATDLDALRERLAAKLGGARPPEVPPGSPVVRVSSRLEATPAPAEPALRHAAPERAPSAAVLRAAPRRAAAAAAHGAAPHAARAAAPALAPEHAAGHAKPHWAYQGDAGPAAWGALRPEFSTCAVGQRQSPIDIRGGIAVDLEPVLFDYRAGGFGVLDNGHTIQVNVPGGNSIQVGGRRYELVQFHFHRPSEERINGRQYEMDAHLVHRDAEGKLAVVAVLFERGEATQRVVQTVWNHLPLEKNEENRAGSALDLNHLLPPDRRYYTYMGSLTTPPCSEGVLWMVMQQPVALTQAQIDIFARLYPMNARPIQQASGRLIKQSQ